MIARTVYDSLSNLPEAQRAYRESPEFRHFIEEFEACRRLAEETLSVEEYERFITEELPKIIRAVR